VFRTRCPRATPLCKITPPPLTGEARSAFACHHPLEDTRP
jgi:ABC-type antimicrobial peptide transport system ATPase subunit